MKQSSQDGCFEGQLSNVASEVQTLKALALQSVTVNLTGVVGGGLEKRLLVQERGG